MRKDILFTTWHSNDKLYQMMSSFLDANVIPIDASVAIRYFLSLFEVNWGNIKWLIHVDEDVFVFDLKKLYALIEYMETNEFDIAGIPDGGVIEMRGNTPLSINPFFSIFNYKKVQKTLTSNPNLNFEYEDLIKYLPTETIKEGMRYDLTKVSESYNPLFFNLLRNGCKFLWLDGETSNDDGLSTYLLNRKKEPFLIHTWFARRYNSNIKVFDYPRDDIHRACSLEFNTQRINNIFRNHETLKLATKQYKKQNKKNGT